MIANKDYIRNWYAGSKKKKRKVDCDMPAAGYVKDGWHIQQESRPSRAIYSFMQLRKL